MRALLMKFLDALTALAMNAGEDDFAFDLQQTYDHYKEKMRWPTT